MKTAFLYPQLHLSNTWKIWIIVLACWAIWPGTALYAQSDTLPVSIILKDRAGLQDPTLARIKTSAVEFAEALSPIFNGTVSLKVDDEIMYPLNRYEDQSIYSKRFADRAELYDREVEVARARPQLRSDLAGDAFILAVRQMSGEGLAMQVRFKVKLPAIEGLSEEEQIKLEGDLAAEGEKAAAGGNGGIAVARGIDAMRVVLQAFDELEETPGIIYNIVDCPPGNYGNYFVTPSGAVVSPPVGSTFEPYFYDNVKDWPRGTLASFKLNGELYVGVWRAKLSIFDAYVKKKDWDKLLTAKLAKKEAITLKELKDGGIIYTGFTALDPGPYNITAQILNGGVLQTYNFQYNATRSGQVTGPKISGSIISKTSTSTCNFCVKYKNSPGFKYYDDQANANPGASQEQQQIWCEQAKAFNNVAGEVATETEFDVAYWDNFMRGIYGQTLTGLTYNQTHAEYVAGLYAFANWYKGVKASLYGIDDPGIMALSIMWLPKEVLQRIDCSIRLKIIDVLLSEELKGKSIFTNEDSRGAFIRLLQNSENDAKCLIEALVIKDYSTISKQDLIALTIVGLPDESLQALDCTLYTKVINALLSQSLNSNESKAGLLKLLTNSADLAPCLFQLLKASCTYSTNLFESYKSEQLMTLADLLSKLTLIAMKDWSAADLRAVYKGEKYYIGKLPKIYCRVNPQINIDAKIQGCKIDLRYSYPMVEAGFNCGTLQYRTGEYNFFDLIVLIPISDVNQWSAGQVQVVPAAMLLYLSSEQAAVRKDAAVRGTTVVGGLVGAVLSLGIITSAEVGVLTQSAALLGALGGLTEASVTVAEDEIKKLFDKQEDANELIGTIKAISLSLMAIDAAVNLAPIVVNVTKAGLLLAKVKASQLASETYLKLNAFIANARLILKIGVNPGKDALEAILYQNWVIVTRVLSDFTDLAKQYSSIVAARLIQSGKGQDFLLFLKTEFYTLYATKGANGDAIRKLLLSLLDRNWEKPELFAEFLKNLGEDQIFLAKLLSFPDIGTQSKWIDAWIILKNANVEDANNIYQLKYLVDNLEEVTQAGGYYQWKSLPRNSVIKYKANYKVSESGQIADFYDKNGVLIARLSKEVSGDDFLEYSIDLLRSDGTIERTINQDLSLTLERGGVFSADLYIDAPSLGFGTAIIDDGVSFWGNKINSFEGKWVVSPNYPKGLSDNLIKYREGLSANLSPQDAARATITGGWAKRYGFVNVEFKGDYSITSTKVTVFFKP